ncbi:MAG: Fur family transcriptional regulator [Boseongicola sp.]
MDTIGFSTHDHHACIADCLVAVESSCKDAGLQLTPVRRRVLQILLTEHRAMGAYEILDRLREDGQNAQPPAAYRALDFLVSNGFAHRIERLNAFIACAHPTETHSPAFMICRICDSVAETHAALSRGALGKAAREAGFLAERTVLEIEGVCPNCQEQEPKDAG